MRFASVVIASLLLAPLAHAVGDAFVPAYVQGTCIVDANDPFEPDQRMQTGPLKGLCINPVLRRSAQILPAEIARSYFDVREGDVVVSNFSHQGKFWLARIPIGAATNVRLLVENFPIVKLPVAGALNVAHTQFRFGFLGQKILLKPQTRETSLATVPLELGEMIFSVENTGPFGEKFDAGKGLKGHYNIAYRAVSVPDKYDWMVAKQGHQVDQYRLALNAREAARLLYASLQEGTHYGVRRTYGTLGPNCSTELFVLVDNILGTSGNRPAIPNYAPDAFQRRGLVSDDALPSLDQEFANGVTK